MSSARQDDRAGFRIEDLASMEPFLMAVVSGGDRWMYLASTGGLTAGRRDPDGAIFPYETDDRLCRADGTVGPRSVLWVERGEGPRRWEPFLRAADGLHVVRRTLWKSVWSDEVRFEERNEDLGLSMRYGWRSGRRFGFVREVELHNHGDRPARVRLLDGLVGIVAAGVDAELHARFSNLVDAYEQAELLAPEELALFHLGSVPTDRATPNEALTANVAWVRGLERPTLLLSERQLAAFRRGEPVRPESRTRGVRGAFLAAAEFELAPGETRRWRFGLDARLDASGVVELREALGPASAAAPELDRAIAADLAEDRARLQSHVAAADGLQATGEPVEDGRHLANALFNVMRGGVFLDEGRVRRADFAEHLAVVAPLVAARVDLSSWPESCPREVLVEHAVASGDPDLERLAREFLPLTFSRRHGDPSRPWNRFVVDTHHHDGRPRLRFEGNWRDIFQNWEALLESFPAYAEAVVVKFVNASTRDGFNPFSIASEGIDWEVPDPSDPWAHIGYWGDHQVVYLQRLLDLCERFRPGALGLLLRRRVFVFADVPYRLADYADMLADPRETIRFDAERDREIRAHAARMGNEARLVPEGPRGEIGPRRVTLGEKLLVPILAKLSQFVPGLGIWMNTQRPEWNDANNALVGRGVSVVTAAWLLRHCASVARIFAEAGEAPVPVSAALARQAHETLEALAGDPDRARPRTVLDRLGEAGTRYRRAVYEDAAEADETIDLSVEQVEELLDRARVWLRATVRANLRADGLMHAYNLLGLDDAGEVRARRLPLMLEGQVAALSCGALDPVEAADLLDALARSPLRRADLGAYLLQPDRESASFLDKGVVPESEVADSPLLHRLLEAGCRRIVRRDAAGVVRFAPELRNAEVVAAVCERLGLSDAERKELLALYERVFDHAAFLGRSGAFFAYEGLGSVYWHMVSKLRLAVLETWSEACARGAAPEVLARLERHYQDVRASLGTGLEPARYGAFPSDPYSHTPAHAGPRQPGMTGQVKEDLLARRLELGVRVQGGRLGLVGPALHAGRPLGEDWRGRLGAAPECAAGAGSVAFSVCGVPVVLRVDGRSGAGEATAWLRDGRRVRAPDGWLDAELSRAIFARSGQVVRLEATVRPARGGRHA